MEEALYGTEKNKNAERVPSGIYIVLSSDLSGKETVVGKILFFH